MFEISYKNYCRSEYGRAFYSCGALNLNNELSLLFDGLLKPCITIAFVIFCRTKCPTSFADILFKTYRYLKVESHQ